MGNIVAGHNFISRRLDEKVFGWYPICTGVAYFCVCYIFTFIIGFTLPLIVNEGGDKFGKSIREAIWLDPKLTTPFDMFQFFIRTPDNIVERHLNLFTCLRSTDIENIMYRHKVRIFIKKATLTL